MSQKSVKFHIKSDDYFGTLAAVLSLIRQTPEHSLEHAKSILKIEKDLLFLQNKFRIVNKYK